MSGPSFNELVRAIVTTLATAWRPCEPLLATAALIALAIAGVAGLLFPSEVAGAVSALPMFVLTLIVSAGVGGYIVSNEPAFTRFTTVLREQRSYGFAVRYILLSIGLLLPILVLLPTVAAPGEGATANPVSVLVILLVLIIVMWLWARLSIFPYGIFVAPPLLLRDAFEHTKGYALIIIGCLLLFALTVFLVLTLLTSVVTGVFAGLGSATGLATGVIAGLAFQSLGQIAAAYVIDCVYGTITRMLVTPAEPPRLQAENG